MYQIEYHENPDPKRNTHTMGARKHFFVDTLEELLGYLQMLADDFRVTTLGFKFKPKASSCFWSEFIYVRLFRIRRGIGTVTGRVAAAHRAYRRFS